MGVRIHWSSEHSPFCNLLLDKGVPLAEGHPIDDLQLSCALALQLPFLQVSESMGNHDSKVVDAGGVD